MAMTYRALVRLADAPGRLAGRRIRRRHRRLSRAVSLEQFNAIYHGFKQPSAPSPGLNRSKPSSDELAVYELCLLVDGRHCARVGQHPVVTHGFPRERGHGKAVTAVVEQLRVC